MEDNNDIMIGLKDEELQELSDMYEPYKNDLPQVYGCIQTCIRGTKQSGMSDFATVMSPGKSWKEDGTFFALLKHNNSYVVFFHSLDISGKNIIEGILNTKKFKYLPNLEEPYTVHVYYGIHQYFYPRIFNLLTNQMHLKMTYQNFCTMYCLKKEEALKASISIPSNIYIKDLKPEEAYIIDSVWTYRFPGSEEGFRNLLRVNGGCGLYLKENDQLVSWITLACLGELASLHTLEGHRRKGYAKLVTKYMCKKLAERGSDSVVAVAVGNTTSELLFENLSFQKLGLFQYFSVKKI